MSARWNDSEEKREFTKRDYINYWIDTANDDWKAVKKMLEGRTYIHALFFMHLVLEKLLKAHWVKDNSGNYPPKVHDLVRISEQTDLQMVKTDLNFLKQMNLFQLEGRYPDYVKKLFRLYKQKRTYAIFVSVNTLRKCLLRKLR